LSLKEGSKTQNKTSKIKLEVKRRTQGSKYELKEKAQTQTQINSYSKMDNQGS
jgi:hypothetical protein